MYAHLAMRDLCRQAFELLESEYGIDDDRLVEMMDKQHDMLRDYLGYNVPEIEALILADSSALPRPRCSFCSACGPDWAPCD